MPRRSLIEGSNRISLRLNQLIRRVGNEANGIYSVSYDAPYAVYVHEDLSMQHSNGQAKYLEQPARQHKRELANIVRKHAQRTGSVRVGMLMASRRLLAYSQRLVPVRTGKLKRSGKINRER